MRRTNEMADWDAALYRQFEDERTRPAADLLRRVPLEAPNSVVDLGCGPGNSTELLRARFPHADLLGIDTSEDMLASARSRLPDVLFEKGDIAEWRPSAAPDVLYANASLQWVPDHERLLPRLVGMLAPGGVLAVQMPDNLEEPTHRLMREVAADGPWAVSLASAAARRQPLPPIPALYDLLAPHAANIDVWRTDYQHPLASPRAIVDWVRGTGLRPFLDPLPQPLRAEFLARYEARLAEAYLPRADGRVLLAFPRLFLVAQRG
jgi:trans-aconitate 2-methyltransferase